MTYRIIAELSESKLYASLHALEKDSEKELLHNTHLILLGLRVVLDFADTADWARAYLTKTMRHGKFDQWRSDGTDLYALLYGLVSQDIIHPEPFIRWIRNNRAKHPDNEVETRRLFAKVDELLKVKDGSLKTLRRSVMEWRDLDRTEQHDVVTKLVRLLNKDARKAEVLPKLERVKRALADEPVKEAARLDFLASLAENATSGSTSAASVATVVGGLGAGFDPNGDRGIYQNKPIVLRRGGAPAPTKKTKKRED